ncbi:hypothetical protein SKAU_G00247750 [Synaphobranchus kaupii]|uniref:Uncharacterized protein n=1 Tax=Synaphobranchus kaupii TaxID=118154 RepID=A0A9Q1F2H4_SYNKA|nr:hypothetical protein SKAU_G00247750 [Synaphobranchus kaupii]
MEPPARQPPSLLSTALLRRSAAHRARELFPLAVTQSWVDEGVSLPPPPLRAGGGAPVSPCRGYRNPPPRPSFARVPWIKQGQAESGPLNTSGNEGPNIYVRVRRGPALGERVEGERV